MSDFDFAAAGGAQPALDPLSELSRTTTAYHEASIDRIEDAREEYLEALRNFNAAQGLAAQDS